MTGHPWGTAGDDGLACQASEIPSLAAAWPDVLRRRWLPWVAVPRTRGIGKAPCAFVKGRWQLVDAYDPSHWLTAGEALHACTEAQRTRRGALAGVGVVLTPETGVVCIDLDGAWESGRLTPLADDVVTLLDGYAEASVTNGVHVLVRGQIGKEARRRVTLIPSQRLELLDRSFVTVTARTLANSSLVIPERQAALDDLVARHPGPRVAVSPPVTRAVTPSDAQVLDAARGSRRGARFSALYDRGAWEETGLGRSEADAALIATLLRFSAGDRAQTLRLLRASRLYREDKTDRVAARDGRSYAQLTVDRVARHLGYPGAFS